VARAFGAYKLGALKMTLHKNKFLTVLRRNTNKGYKLMILLKAILTLCAMNIGKMTFKHGHILMMEFYILLVKAVDVEYIGKYKDERAYAHWMSGFVDIINVAKCPIDMTFFVKLSISITKDL
jgi:hypothetical protein